jgi:2,4-diketo-3-deoxy-L-fuconate hydrolase
MRLCRYILNSDAAASEFRLGVMDERGIRDVTAVTALLAAQRWPLPPGDQLIGSLDMLRGRIEDLARVAPVMARSEVRLLSPVANPGKIICGVGNWSHHKAPLGMLGFLFKATSALAGEAEGVQVRWPDRTTLHGTRHRHRPTMRECLADAGTRVRGRLHLCAGYDDEGGARVLLLLQIL